MKKFKISVEAQELRSFLLTFEVEAEDEAEAVEVLEADYFEQNLINEEILNEDWLFDEFQIVNCEEVKNTEKRKIENFVFNI